MIKIIAFFKKRSVQVGTAVVVLGIFGALFFRGDSAPAYQFSVAERRDLLSEVSVTGRVKAAESVDLAFEGSGRVSRVYVEVGDRVSAGQALVSLGNSEASAQLLQAEADVRVQESKLLELQRGTRPEEILVQEVKVANAKVSLEDAKKNLLDKLEDSYAKSNDAVRAKTAGIFSGYRTSAYILTYSSCSGEVEIDAKNMRASLDYMLDAWRLRIDALPDAPDTLTLIREAVYAKQKLTDVRTFLDLTHSTLTTGCTIADSSLDTYRTNIASARTSIESTIGNLSTAEEKLRTAESALALAEQELALKQSGTAPEQIISQEALLQKAKASVAQYESQLAKTILRSPIFGVVTEQEAKVGEIVSAGAVVASLISEAKFEIEANVPEADIAKIKIGDSASVTLDAYGRDTQFEANVIALSPAETIVEGVATYKMTLQFKEEDERVKSGMTAKITVRGETRENVIVIPQRAIIRRNGDVLVRVWDGTDAKEVSVVLGLRGSDGNVEAVSGVNEGDKVVTFVEE